mgnify:FL=1
MTCSLVFSQTYREFAKEMGYETEYKTALQKAKKENKELMVLMVTNYCPWCSKFEKKTLSDKKVDDAVKSKYIPLIINRQEGGFPSYLHTPIVPVTFFVNPQDEKVIHESVGFSNKLDFLNLLEQLK